NALVMPASAAYFEGRWAEAASTADEAIALCAVRAFTADIDALAALAEGRFRDAMDHYASIAPPGMFPPYGQVAVWNVFDVVEAAVGSGRIDDARRHLGAAFGLGVPALSDRLRFLCDAAAAGVAPDDAYEAAFDELLARPDAHRWPFHLARIELTYGDRLRHDREIRRARTHLRRAVDLFEALDAR